MENFVEITYQAPILFTRDRYPVLNDSALTLLSITKTGHLFPQTYWDFEEK